LCDNCDAEYHTFCLDPPLESVPVEENWYCPVCQPSFTKDTLNDQQKKLKRSGRKRKKTYKSRGEDAVEAEATPPHQTSSPGILKDKSNQVQTSKTIIPNEVVPSKGTLSISVPPKSSSTSNTAPLRQSSEPTPDTSSGPLNTLPTTKQATKTSLKRNESSTTDARGVKESEASKDSASARKRAKSTFHADAAHSSVDSQDSNEQHSNRTVENETEQSTSIKTNSSNTPDKLLISNSPSAVNTGSEVSVSERGTFPLAKVRPPKMETEAASEHTTEQSEGVIAIDVAAGSLNLHLPPTPEDKIGSDSASQTDSPSKDDKIPPGLFNLATMPDIMHKHAMKQTPNKGVITKAPFSASSGLVKSHVAKPPPQSLPTTAQQPESIEKTEAPLSNNKSATSVPQVTLVSVLDVPSSVQQPESRSETSSRSEPSTPTLKRSRSGRMVKRSSFHDEIDEGEQHLRSPRYAEQMKKQDLEKRFTETIKSTEEKIELDKKSPDTPQQEEPSAKKKSQAEPPQHTVVKKDADCVPVSSQQQPLTVDTKPSVAPPSILDASSKSTATEPVNATAKKPEEATVAKPATSAPAPSQSPQTLSAIPPKASPATHNTPPINSQADNGAGPPAKVPRRKPGARECMQISRRFGVNVIPQKYMDILLDYCTRGKVEHLIRMRERLDDHSRMLEAQLAGLEALVKEKGELTTVVSPDQSGDGAA